MLSQCVFLKGCVFLAERSAVIFLTDDTARTGYAKPLFLQNIMGFPVLFWLADGLLAGGCSRFFLVCSEKLRADARHCFPEGADVTVSCGADTADQLHVFLSTADDSEADVCVITAPCLLLPKSTAGDFSAAPVPTGVYDAGRRQLMDALDDRFSFPEFLEKWGRRLTDRDGFYNVTSTEDLARWQPVLSRETLTRLVKTGVEIWDFSSTYVEPDVFVGPGTVLLPGTILRSGTVVGRNCRIGPNALLESTKVDDGASVNASQLYDAIVGAGSAVGPFACIRPGTIIGKNCRVGNFVEVKNSVIGDDTKLSHLTYVGDSDVGSRVNFGCGAVTANYDRVKKHRTLIGDDAFIGCGTKLVAPVTVGAGAYTAAGSTITEDVPDDALAVSRSRQTNKLDWAKTHKTKEK